jgi:hypothetical protein
LIPAAEARETTLRKELGEAERRIREQEHLLEEALNRLKVHTNTHSFSQVIFCPACLFDQILLGPN